MRKVLVVVFIMLFLGGVAYGAEQQKAKTPADFSDQELSQIIEKTGLQIQNMRLQAENLGMRANALEQALKSFQDESQKRIKAKKVEPKKVEEKKGD